MPQLISRMISILYTLLVACICILDIFLNRTRYSLRKQVLFIGQNKIVYSTKFCGHLSTCEDSLYSESERPKWSGTFQKVRNVK